MAGKIPQQFIDDLLARCDIVDLIDSRVPLKKAGRDYQACCPFHNEKTASFTVSPGKQFYHCFGCGAHGTAIGFLMAYDNLEFVEAVEALADNLGLSVPREDGSSPPPMASNSKALLTLTEQASRFYQRQLREHPARQEAVDYLKGRGLSGQIAARFALGFSADDWHGVHHALGRDAASCQRLVEVGLLVKKSDGGYYDRFRHRIMFPIRDLRGRVIGFGGRLLNTPAASGVDNGPKYLNSPETPLFHKGRELYGFYEACQANRNLTRLLVVEGYMDVIALAQHGVDYAVATLGTATTSEHIERMFRKVDDIVFCFDGDRAGRAAAWRALENALPALDDGRQLRFMFLPEGEDPDSLVRKEGGAGFARRIERASTLSQYLFSQAGAECDSGTLDGRARLADSVKPLLKKMAAGSLRHMLILELAQRARVEPEVLQFEITGQTSPAAATQNRQRPPPARDRTPSLVRKAIVTLLQQPALAHDIGEPGWLREIDEAGITLLIDLLELLRQHPHLSTGGILERFRDSHEGRHLAKLAAQPVLLDANGLRAEWRDTLQRLRHLADEHQLKRLEERDRLGVASQEEKAELKRRYRNLGQINESQP